MNLNVLPLLHSSRAAVCFIQGGTGGALLETHNLQEATRGCDEDATSVKRPVLAA